MYIFIALLSALSVLATTLGTIFFGFTPPVWAYVPYTVGGLISLLAPVCLMAKRYKKHPVWGILTGGVFLLITVAHFVTAAIPGNHHPTNFLPEGTVWLTAGTIATILLLLVAPIVLALCQKVKKAKNKKKQSAGTASINTVPVATIGLVEVGADEKEVHFQIQVKSQPHDGYLVFPVAFGPAPQKGRKDTRNVLYFTIEPGQRCCRRQISIGRGGDNFVSILEYNQMDLTSASQKTRIPDIPAYEIAAVSSVLPPPAVVSA